MSRWALALVALSFALAPLHAADPKPLWEIDTYPNAKRPHSVKWLGYSSDGKTLMAQVEDELSRNADRYSTRFFTWDALTRKEKLNLKLGEHLYSGPGMYANATTKTGDILVAGEVGEKIQTPYEIKGEAKIMRNRSDGVWHNRETSDTLFLRLELDDCSIMYGKMTEPGKKGEPERWFTTPLPGDFSGGLPVVSANGDLTRLALGLRNRKLTLYEITTDRGFRLTQVASVPSAHVGAISTMCFSPAGGTLATGSEDPSICLWSVPLAGKDWKPRVTIPTGKYTVGALAFNPSGTTLAAGTFDAKGGANLYLIDVPKGKLLASHRLDAGVTALAFSPDGKTLVTGNSKGRIQAWDAEEILKSK